MYKKDLNEAIRLRLSTQFMDFLRSLSEDRGTTISECIRSIIGEYKRSVETIGALNQTARFIEMAKELSDGDTEPNKHNLV